MKLSFDRTEETYPIHFDCQGGEKGLEDCKKETARPCECDLVEHTTDVFIECNGAQKKRKFKYSAARRNQPVLSFMVFEKGISEGGDMIDVLEKYISNDVMPDLDLDGKAEVQSTTGRSFSADYASTTFAAERRTDVRESISQDSEETKGFNPRIESSEFRQNQAEPFERELWYILSGIIFITVFGVALWFYVKN